MKKLLALVLLFFCLFAPLFASEPSEPEEKDGATLSSPASSDFSLEGMTTGPGLLLIGGAGAGITAYNLNHRKENQPSKEIKADEGKKRKKRGED